jgi:SAM-dependent methyltransferase
VNNIKAWSAAAQSLALVEAAYEHGWMAFLTEPRHVADLGAVAGLTVDRARAVVTALAAIDVVVTDGDQVWLSGPYAEALSSQAPFTLDDRLAEARMMRRLVAESVSAQRSMPDEQDALVVVNAYGLRPTSVAQDLFGQFRSALPELTDAVRAGRYLDVGCGVAGFLLSTAQVFPAMRGVGVEVVPAVAAEAERRARAVGVADRVEVRGIDARKLTDEDAFDVAFWAQPFFPASTRPGVLVAIHRALRPSAALYMQEMERLPEDPEEARAFALCRLIFSGWDVPFAASAEALADEAANAGYVLDRIADTPFGRIVITRKPKTDERASNYGA